MTDAEALKKIRKIFDSWREDELSDYAFVMAMTPFLPEPKTDREIIEEARKWARNEVAACSRLQVLLEILDQ